jgi:hypothetical protein
VFLPEPERRCSEFILSCLRFPFFVCATLKKRQRKTGQSRQMQADLCLVSFATTSRSFCERRSSVRMDIGVTRALFFFFFVAASAPYNDIMKDGQLKATTKRLVENCFILETQLCAEIPNWIKLGKRIEFV